ncbi:MAG: hypothetical protein IJW75_03065 [Alphaproteobacteria bacterium]|nr:hypothetical protein [Alphaproteobacteria bacterium]
MEKCKYDYANKCDCSEDDNCGCTYPNNMCANFECEYQKESHKSCTTDKKDLSGDKSDK